MARANGMIHVTIQKIQRLMEMVLIHRVCCISCLPTNACPEGVLRPVISSTMEPVEYRIDASGRLANEAMASPIVRRGLKVGRASATMRLPAARTRKIRMTPRRAPSRVSEHSVGSASSKLAEDESVFAVVNNRALRLRREKGQWN